MNNLFLPEVDLSEVPDFKMQTAGYWSLKNPSVESYRHIPNVFTPDQCQEIIKLGKSFYVDQSKTFGGTGFNEVRKSKNSWLPPCELTRWIFETIQAAVIKVNKHYEYDLHSMENLQFTEYDETYKGYYDAHVDAFDNETSPNTHRKLSFSIQLTDETAYDGGDLLIYSHSKQPIKAMRQQGLINFFPSFVLHEVTPVTRGTRYSLVSWISGPKFK